MSIIFEGDKGVTLYTAIVMRAALKMYMNTGMKANRAYTPTNMLKAASRITGIAYKRGEYGVAVFDLDKWIKDHEHDAASSVSAS